VTLEVLAVLALTGLMTGVMTGATDGARSTLPAKPDPSPVDSILGRPPSPFRVTSTSFAADEAIPVKHTCEGGDIAPALAWSGVPDGARSFALIVDDPDAPDPTAPKTVWVHWVAYNIPASVSAIPEGVKAGGLPKGSLDGVNDGKKPGYSGPCPPTGRHRYYFKVYALDTRLADLKRPTKARLLEAMKGHVLAQSELVGTYEKKAKPIGMQAIGGTPGSGTASHGRK
jgi:Raf kinase inhibitor-like YbhB/YbcL family protein